MTHEIPPHQFFGGTETELAVTPIFKDQRKATEHDCGAMAMMAIANMPKDLHVTPSRAFEKAGRRIYKDVGGLLEVTTAEFRSYRDLVHATIAGEYLAVTGALNAAKNRHDLSSVAILGRLIDDKDTTWGHHENYLVRRNTFSEDITDGDRTGYNTLRKAMCAHIASRTIFAGAGILRPVHDNPARVTAGQKSRSLHCDISSNTTRLKPLFNIRDEPHADANDWARLHIVSGDYNISPFASWLRFGTTAIVAYLSEIGMINKNSRMFLEEGEAAAVARAVGNNPYATFHTGSGGMNVNAVDLQEQFCEVAEDCADNYPGLLSKEDLEIISSWRDTIDTYRKDPAALTHKIDYLGRANFLKNFYDKRPEGADKLKQVEEYWDNLIMGKAVELRDEAGMPGYDEREITHWLRQPPLDTRANIRGKIIELGAHMPDVTVRGEWRNVKIYRGGESMTLSLSVESNGTPDDRTLTRLTNFLGIDITEEYFSQHPDCRKDVA